MSIDLMLAALLLAQNETAESIGYVVGYLIPLALIAYVVWRFMSRPKCPYCGARIQRGAQNCEACGAKGPDAATDASRS